MSDNTMVTILAAIERIHTKLVKLDEGQTRLEEGQTNLRVDLIARMDRLGDQITAMRDDIWTRRPGSMR